MKLRTIALASLLGAGLLMTSGCNEDDIKDAVKDNVKPNAVYIVNAHPEAIQAYADQDSKDMKYKDVKTFALDGKDETTVYYKLNNNSSKKKEFKFGNAYLYVASPNCNLTNGLGYVEDTSTGNGIVELVNATNNKLVADNTHSITITVDGKKHLLTLKSGTEVGACTKATSKLKISDLGIKKGSKVSVTIGTTTSKVHEVEEEIPTSVDVDIVYLGGEDAVAVPLVKWDDLLK